MASLRTGSDVVMDLFEMVMVVVVVVVLLLLLLLLLFEQNLHHQPATACVFIWSLAWFRFGTFSQSLHFVETRFGYRKRLYLGLSPFPAIVTSRTSTCFLSEFLCNLITSLDM